MTNPRLIVIGPLPPPVHGVAVSTGLVLANEALREHFVVEHLDTSDHRSGGNIGKWDVVNGRAALRDLVRLAARLRGRRGVVYLPLSQSTPGFLRDSLFMLLAHAFRWRIAVHLRGSEFRAYYEASPPLWMRWIRSTLRRSHSIAVMGESLKSVFLGLVPEARVVVVPNGTPEPSPTDVVRDPHHVVFLSNLRRRKGVLEAVEAALLVRQELPSARFTFAGTWESDELRSEVAQLVDGSSSSIEFRCSVAGIEKDMLLASAVILLFPPVEPEGHPRVVLEAIAAGLPVVTTDRGAISETVIDGKTGFVLKEPDPHLLADCMLSLLQDQLRLEQFGRASRQHYLDLFTQERADRILADWLGRVGRVLPAAVADA